MKFVRKVVDKKPTIELNHKVYLIIKRRIEDDAIKSVDILKVFLFKEVASKFFFRMMVDKSNELGGLRDGVNTPPYEPHQENDNSYNTLYEIDLFEKYDQYRYGLYEYELNVNE